MKPSLLDTNVVSELLKPDADADPAVIAWVEQADWFVPAPVVAEMQEGAEAVTSAARKAQLLARLDLFLVGHTEVLLDWDVEAARTWRRRAPGDGSALARSQTPATGALGQPH